MQTRKRLSPTGMAQAFGLACLLLFSACKKETPNNPEGQSAKQKLTTLAQKRAYLQTHLRNGGAAVAKALQNPQFKAILMAELMASDNPNHEIQLSALAAHPQLSSFVNAAQIAAAVDAFTDLDGQDWQPNLRLNVRAAVDRRQNIDDPNQQGGGATAQEVFAINEGWAEDETPVIPALYYQDGELIPIDGLFLTEGYTADHQVWVIELDETPVDQTMGATDVFGPTSCNNNREPSFKSKIDKVTVKSRKEFWLGGASDVAILRLTTWRTPNFAQSTVSAQSESWQIGDAKKEKWHYYSNGIKIEVNQCVPNEFGDNVKSGGFTKEEVKKKQERVVSFDLIKAWKPLCGSDRDAVAYPTCNKAYCLIKGNLMGYVIFERDPWPARTRTARLYNPVNPSVFTDILYTSFETSYAENWIDYVHPQGPTLVGNIKGHSVNNNDIKFNTKIEF